MLFVSLFSFVANVLVCPKQTSSFVANKRAKRKSQKTADGQGKKKKGTYDVLPDALNALEPKDIVHIISEEIVLDCDMSHRAGQKSSLF
jgi:hypothetical protein